MNAGGGLMKILRALGVVLVAGLISQYAGALAMGPDEFAAARQLTCVLAQESLGYLDASEYADQTQAVLEDFDQAESDVIYAKAIGYYDGLMFGVEERDHRGVNDRLQAFVSSQACLTRASHAVML
jgi:hypothetical protein